MSKIAPAASNDSPTISAAVEDLSKRRRYGSMTTNHTTTAEDWVRTHLEDASKHSAPPPPSDSFYSNNYPLWMQHPPPVAFHHAYTFPMQPPPGDDLYERQPQQRHHNSHPNNNYYAATRPNPPSGRTTRPNRIKAPPPPPIVTQPPEEEADLYAALLQSTCVNYGSTAWNHPSTTTGKRLPTFNNNNGPSPRSITAATRGGGGKPPSRNNSFKNLLEYGGPHTPPPQQHRRAHSDGIPRLVVPRRTAPNAASSRTALVSNKRAASGKNEWPPSVQQRRLSGALPSPRRLAAGGSSSSVGATQPAPKGHRRVSSGMSQFSAASYAGTEASMMSFVSDIRQSAFFGGVNESTGQVQMHFPSSNVHLLPIDKTREEQYHPPLQIGRIYQVAVHEKDYEAYHRAAEDGASWENDDDDSMMSEIGIDGDYHRSSSSPRKLHPACQCPQCTFHRSAPILGPGYYCLTVEDTIYQRVLDEVCASQSMPCGLFFCGHHEDVSRPSMWIPGTIVVLLLTVMGWVAYYY